MTSVVSSAAPVRLRCGILVDAPGVNAWQAATLHHLERSGVAELELVVTVEGSHVPGEGRIGKGPRAPRRAEAGQGRIRPRCDPHLALQGHAAARGRRVARRRPDDPRTGRPRGAGGRRPSRCRPREHPEPPLDVVIWLGAGTPTAGAVAEVARHGTWLFRHATRRRRGAARPASGSSSTSCPWSGRPCGDCRCAAAPRVHPRCVAAGSPSRAEQLRPDARPGPVRARPPGRRSPAARSPSGPPSRLASRSPAGQPASLRRGAFGRPRHVLRFLAVIARWPGCGGLASRAAPRRLEHRGRRRARRVVPGERGRARCRVGPGAQGSLRGRPVRALDRGAELQVHLRGLLARDGTGVDRPAPMEPGAGLGAIRRRPSRSAATCRTRCSSSTTGATCMLPESRASGRPGAVRVRRSSTAPGGRPRRSTWTAPWATPRSCATSDRWWLFAVAPSRLNPFTELHSGSPTGPRGRGTSIPLNPVVVDSRSARPAGPLFVGRRAAVPPGPGLLDGLRRPGDHQAHRRPHDRGVRGRRPSTVVRPDPAGPFPLRPAHPHGRRTGDPRRRQAA